MPLLCNLDAHTSIGALARLGNPDVVRILVFFVVLLERLKVGIVKALLHVESHWKSVEGVLAYGFVIIFHIHEKSFLVAKMVVVFNLVGELTWVRIKWFSPWIVSCLFLRLFLCWRIRR